MVELKAESTVKSTVKSKDESTVELKAESTAGSTVKSTVESMVESTVGSKAESTAGWTIRLMTVPSDKFLDDEALEEMATKEATVMTTILMTPKRRAMD